MSLTRAPFACISYLFIFCFVDSLPISLLLLFCFVDLILLACIFFFICFFSWLDSLSVHFLFFLCFFSLTWFSSPAFSFLNVSYRWFDSLSLHCLSLMFRSVDAFLHYKLIYWLLYFLNNQRQLEIDLKLLNNRTRTKISNPKIIFNNFLALKKSISEKNVFKLLTCWR